MEINRGLADMARIKFTMGRLTEFSCKPEQAQAFLWDSETPGLALRATPPGKRNTQGSKAYIFQGKLDGKDLRVTIGDFGTWALDEARDKNGDVILPGARQEARRLKSLIDQGRDPRQVKAEIIEAAQMKRDEKAAAVMGAEQAALRQVLTVGEVWGVYIEARRAKWGERTLYDHLKVVKPERTKGEGENQKTLTAAVLSSLMPLPLSGLTSECVISWLEVETPKRGTQAALAFRLLRAFVNWCETKPRENETDYRGIADPMACAKSVSKERVKSGAAKKDALQREQLRLWFEFVRRIQNPTIAIYLQGLLITGARRNELAELRWQDVDFQWKSLTIRDKVEGERTIPLTSYFSSLLRQLQNANETAPTVRRIKTLSAKGESWKPSQWVFSSPTSATGRLQEPSIAHRKAIAAAGLPALSLHGLRRSFGSLSEWCEVPVGVVAQIMGHKPSATAEKHYRERPLDLLRMWHSKIEGWILEQAGIEQPSEEAKPGLKVVA